MQINEVEVSGQKFQITSEKITGNTGIVWKYYVLINDIEYTLGATVTSDLIDTLNFCGFDVDKELRYILTKEIQMEIFSKLHPDFYKLMKVYRDILSDPH